MATTLKDLLVQRQALEEQITKLTAAEQADAIAKVRKLIEDHKLTQDDIFPRASSAKSRKTSTAAKVAAKYKDPLSNATWSGRGLAPKWIAGQDKSKFLIA